MAVAGISREPHEALWQIAIGVVMHQYRCGPAAASRRLKSMTLMVEKPADDVAELVITAGALGFAVIPIGLA